MDGWDAYEFNIISEHPDITRDALKVIEGNLIRQHNPPYNTQRNPSRTEDDVKEYYKDYYEQHSDMKKKYAKERGLLRYACECGANVRFVEKARHFKSKKHTG